MTGSRPKPPAPRRVLIIKPSSLGDVVSAVPVLRGLRRTFPDARISWLIVPNCAGLIRHDSDLDEVILFDRNRLGRSWWNPAAAVDLAKLIGRLNDGSFDWVIDLQGLWRSGLLAMAAAAPVRAGFADTRERAVSLLYTHRVRAKDRHTIERNVALARSLGIDAKAEDVRLQVSEAGAAFGDQLSRDHSLERGRFLACVPPTRWATKQYPPRRWRVVISALIEQVPVAVLGTASDKQLCSAITEGLGAGAINLAGRTSLEQMVGVLGASGGVICSDSAANFIAPALGVGAVCLIGPTRPQLTGPFGRGKAIVADIPCQGCLKRRCRHITCMQLIRPADVIDAALGLLEENA